MSAVIYKVSDIYCLMYSDGQKVIDMDFDREWLFNLAIHAGISSENIFILD